MDKRPKNVHNVIAFVLSASLQRPVMHCAQGMGVMSCDVLGIPRNTEDMRCALHGLPIDAMGMTCSAREASKGHSISPSFAFVKGRSAKIICPSRVGLEGVYVH